MDTSNFIHELPCSWVTIGYRVIQADTIRRQIEMPPYHLELLSWMGLYRHNGNRGVLPFLLFTATEWVQIYSLASLEYYLSEVFLLRCSSCLPTSLITLSCLINQGSWMGSMRRKRASGSDHVYHSSHLYVSLTEKKAYEALGRPSSVAASAAGFGMCSWHWRLAWYGIVALA